MKLRDIVQAIIGRSERFPVIGHAPRWLRRLSEED